MKKIVLTSCGIIEENLKNNFLNLFDKHPKELKVLYIPTAIDGEENDDAEWIEKEFNTILDLGIQKQNITEYRMDYKLDLTKYDFIYMMGGNTFYLLMKIREYDFASKLEHAMKHGVVYVGSSAGSIIMGNTIEASRDENIYIKEDFTGLKYIDGIIIPHANRRNAYVEEQKNKFQDKIYPLYDKHGLIIIENDIKEY